MIDYGNSASIHGDLEVQSFDMLNCAKGFHILISRIYTRKIDAVIREVLCNAYDSHIAAKCESTPVKVTLPTLDDPHFRVQDFGVSLREDQMKMYITLFDSSKENSESETGYYGLGCKSPFSYSNAFNIEVVKDGKRRMYSAFMDGNSAPKLAKLFEIETDDPQGVTVIVPVKTDDFRKFANAYENIAQWFPTTPECVQSEATYVLDGSRYQVTDCTVMDSNLGRLYYRSSYGDVAPRDLHILMGNVAYDVSVHEVLNNMGNDHPVMEYQKRRILSDLTGFIRVPNGAIDIPPSRENVEYTPKTVTYLLGIFEQAYANIVKEYQDDYNVKKTEDFFAAVQVMDRAAQLGLKLDKSELDHFFVGMETLLVGTEVVVRFADNMHNHYTRYNNNVKGHINQIVWNLKNALDYVDDRRKHKLAYTYPDNTVIPATDHAIIFAIGDHQQTTAFFKENQYSYGNKTYGYPIVLEFRKGGKLRRGKPIADDITQLKQVLDKFFSGITVKLTSEMIATDNPEEKELARNRAEFLKIYNHQSDSWYSSGSDSVSSDAWSVYEAAKTDNKPVLAISRRNRDVFHPDGSQIENLNHYIRNLKELGVIDKETVVVSCMASAFERIQKLLPGAKTLKDLEFTLDDIKDKLQVLYTDSVNEALGISNVIASSVYSSVCSDMVRGGIDDDESNNHVLYRYIKDISNTTNFKHNNKRHCTSEYVLEKHGLLEDAHAYMIETAKQRYAGVDKYKSILRIISRDTNADCFFEEYKDLIKLIDKEEE